MSFKVKAALVTFLGNEEKYPCHFCHNVGDTIIFDGEKYVGRLCPDVWPILTPKVFGLHIAGPRYVEPVFYYPFWYEPPSVKDPAKKKYDGLGFANVLETRVEPRYNMANLIPPNANKWPPHPERTVAKDITVICPDYRTAALFKLEAFDLSDKGFSLGPFRRQMVIMDRVFKKQEIPIDSILQEFTKEEQLEIFPALGPENLPLLIEEIELMGYMEIKDGKAFVTEKGEAKVEEFKKSLSTEEREALRI